MITARQAYTMLENASLWETAVHCHEVLDAAEIPHAVIGGVAVCLHGYQRNTTDLDLLIRRDDSASVRSVLEATGLSWHPGEAEFRSPSGVAVQFLLAGDRAGGEVSLPDPADKRTTTQIEGLPVLTLAKLIESKIACGQSHLRRTHKDFADVVELIVRHRLNSSFARFLHKTVRVAYRKLVRTSRGKP